MDASHIISLWPSLKAFADDVGLQAESHVRTMKARNSIPRAYWHDIVAAAKVRRIPVTMDVLKASRPPRAQPVPSLAQAG